MSCYAGARCLPALFVDDLPALAPIHPRSSAF
jgi:hypothetical protein